MRHLAAYLLLVRGGKANPTESDIKALLAAADIEFNADEAKKVVSELAGKDLDELIAQGFEKLQTVPSGAAAAAPAAAAAGSAAPAKEEKKEEEKKEESDAVRTFASC
jgi:large subunit ribosomal protein LP2